MNNEIEYAVKKFLDDLKKEFINSKFARSKVFCCRLLNLLTKIAPSHSNREKLLKVFDWIQTILEIQFGLMEPGTMKDSSEDLMIEENYEVFDERSEIISEEEDKSFKGITANILLFILGCLSENDNTIKTHALRINKILQDRIIDIINADDDPRISPMKEGYKQEDGSFKKIFICLKSMISSNQSEQTTIQALKWIEKLLDYFPEELPNLSPHILENLQHQNMKIVNQSVTLIAECVNKQDSYNMVNEILKFLENFVLQKYEQTKVLSILNTLFNHVKGETIINYFAKNLANSEKIEFKKKMVQNLDLMINIEEKLENLRNSLRKGNNQDFELLFKVWACQPVSCFSLCLMSQQ